MIGILCFLIVVVLANTLTDYISGTMYRDGVVFLNENFWLLLVAILLLVGDIIFAFPFSLNRTAPIIRAIGSVFVIAFTLHVFQWVDSVASTSLYSFVWLLSFAIVPIAVSVAFVSGYFEIMRKLCWGKESETGGDCQVVHEIKKTPLEEPLSDVKSWEDIGDEFRLTMYDIMHRFRHEFRKYNYAVTIPGFPRGIFSLFPHVLQWLGVPAYRDSDVR